VQLLHSDVGQDRLLKSIVGLVSFSYFSFEFVCAGCKFWKL